MSNRVIGTSNQQYLSGVQRGPTGRASDHSQYCTIDQIKNQTEPGELLEFRRGSYTQYALYLGNGKVMNIDAEDGKADEAQIVEGTLQDVCSDVKVRVRNHEDVALSHFQLSAKPSQEIVQTAISYKNQHVPYEFDFRNGEYYCTLWRYGKGFSTEAAKILLDG